MRQKNAVLVIAALVLIVLLSGCLEQAENVLHTDSSNQKYSPRNNVYAVRIARSAERGQTQYCLVMGRVFTVDHNTRVMEYADGTKTFLCCPPCLDNM